MREVWGGLFFFTLSLSSELAGSEVFYGVLISGPESPIGVLFNLNVYSVASIIES